MRYETIKQRAADHAAAGILRTFRYGPFNEQSARAAAAMLFDSVAERRPVADSAEALAQHCRRVIDAWDVRCVGRLRELYPEAFPATLRRGPLVAEITDDGEWHVVPA